jgi:hypothetical protein
MLTGDDIGPWSILKTIRTAQQNAVASAVAGSASLIGSSIALKLRFVN